jgi:hypothetical protein
MKADRGGWRPLEHPQLLQGFPQDAYKMAKKLPEPTVCSVCGAVWHAGRWAWADAPANAHKAMCPACHRIHDKFPAGFIHIGGPFFEEHRDEIVHRVTNVESREKAGHPLERIMGIEETADGIVVTTASVHLARAIGVALEDAWKGELDYHYNEGENLLRVLWRR